MTEVSLETCFVNSDVLSFSYNYTWERHENHQPDHLTLELNSPKCSNTEKTCENSNENCDFNQANYNITYPSLIDRFHPKGIRSSWKKPTYYTHIVHQMVNFLEL